MVSAWFRLRQKKTVELRFRPKLDHVETETGRNWLDQQRQLQRLAVRRRNFPEAAVGWTDSME